MSIKIRKMARIKRLMTLAIWRLIADYKQIYVKRCRFILSACLRKTEKKNLVFFLPHFYVSHFRTLVSNRISKARDFQIVL